jgi:hypothetical protein
VFNIDHTFKVGEQDRIRQEETRPKRHKDFRHGESNLGLRIMMEVRFRGIYIAMVGGQWIPSNEPRISNESCWRRWASCPRSTTARRRAGGSSTRRSVDSTRSPAASSDASPSPPRRRRRPVAPGDPRACALLDHVGRDALTPAEWVDHVFAAPVGTRAEQEDLAFARLFRGVQDADADAWVRKSIARARAVISHVSPPGARPPRSRPDRRRLSPPRLRIRPSSRSHEIFVRGDNASHYTISELAMNVTSTYSYTFLKSNLHTSGIRARGRSGEDAAQIFFEEHSCRMAIWRLGDRSRFPPCPR